MDEEGTFWQRARLRADRSAIERTILEDTIDEFMGDVFNYVNSAGQAEFPNGRVLDVPENVQNVYGTIMQRFREKLIEASNECYEIHILAHF